MSVHLSPQVTEIALLVAITSLEQFVQGFLDCLFGGTGFMCTPDEKENIFEFPNLKTNAFYSCECKINPTKNIGT
jgi:hypothetical protein